MTRIILIVIEAIIIILWAVIAPIFWIPFLVRMVALFIASVLVSVGTDLNLGVAQIGLDRAAKFYPEGFVKIHRSISCIGEGTIDHDETWRPVEEFWQPLAIHLISVALFWGITCAWIYYLFFA